MKLNRALSLLLTTEQGARVGLASAGLFAALTLLGFMLMLKGWWMDARLFALPEAAKSQEAWSASLDEWTQRIPGAHLFGYRSPASAYMPITSSQARLTGIIQQGFQEAGESFSKAIISVQGGVGKVYQVGELLQEGVRITEIQAEAVILDNNGHSERLPLLRARLGGG